MSAANELYRKSYIDVVSSSWWSLEEESYSTQTVSQYVILGGEYGQVIPIKEQGKDNKQPTTLPFVKLCHYYSTDFGSVIFLVKIDGVNR